MNHDQEAAENIEVHLIHPFYQSIPVTMLHQMIPPGVPEALTILEVWEPVNCRKQQIDHLHIQFYSGAQAPRQREMIECLHTNVFYILEKGPATPPPFRAIIRTHHDQCILSKFRNILNTIKELI